MPLPLLLVSRLGWVQALGLGGQETVDPPSDYHKCMEEYAEGDGWRQPGGGGLLHSLCAWWAQGDDVLCTRTPLPRHPHNRYPAVTPAHAQAKLSQRLPGSSGKQLASPAQCSRFTSDEFLQDPKLRDFTSQCESDCVTPPKPPNEVRSIHL